MNDILTVSQVNRYLKSTLDEDVNLKSIYLRGEVSNFTNHVKSGHLYFTLKDAQSSMKAVMFKWNAQHLRFLPENGMNVVVFGSVQLFERDGVCQMYCADIQPDGVGALHVAFEQLKAKLSALGYFDEAHKRPIPALPQRIGVVTAKTGAALQDILQILSRRYPLATVVLIPALVQGEQAPASICAAINAAQRCNLDVQIVGRGGGSMEDLWAFNDETVAKAIYDSKVPVISAVGHEVDYTIADFVADLRAPTPSAAAELVAPEIRSIETDLQNDKQWLSRSVMELIRKKETSYQALKTRLDHVSPAAQLIRYTEKLSSLDLRLHRETEHLLSEKETHFRTLIGQMESLSPLKVLARGYSITLSASGEVAYAVRLNSGDTLITLTADGTVKSTVTEIIKHENRGV